MSRFKHYLTKDVVTAARERIHHTYDIFDELVVMFSGGKDSLAVLELTRQVAAERGIEKVRAVFRDEELIPRRVIDFVDEYRRKPWLDLTWFAVPMASNRFYMGTSLDNTFWEWGREWFREKPDWAVTLPEDDGRRFSQYAMDDFTVQTLGLKGKIAFLTGVRASESLTRYRSVVNKLNENYIVGSSTPGVQLVKPIYDWEEGDLFKWFHQEGIAYCPLYRAQHLSGSGLRISTPVHGEAAKRLGRLKAIDSDLYDFILKTWPEMAVQERYWNELDHKAKLAVYLEDGMDGALRYIEDNIPEGKRRDLAMQRWEEYLGLHEGQPLSYPVKNLLAALAGGVLHRTVLPQKATP